jgi:predicted enzyme related to lactoylglutathione lyase
MTTASETPSARTLDMKFEIVVIPVSDVDRAKRFYAGLGWMPTSRLVTITG